MFKIVSFIAAAAFVASVAAESHQVNLINNCGSGNAVFFQQGQGDTKFGSGTYDRLLGGIAWVDGFAGANCLNSGVNCGIVEFSLTGPNYSDGATQNAADYSLETGNDPAPPHGDLGNHQFTYAMNFAFTGACTDAPGQCTGTDNCPRGFIGESTTNGSPVQCVAENVGIDITFC